MTTVNRSIVETLPNWVRLSLSAAIIIAVPIAYYFDVPMAVPAFVGPLILAHLWTAKRFAHYTRADQPVMYWGAVAVFVLTTAIAYWELSEHFFGVAQ